ncbi:MAG: hypothetical protein QOI05_351 [Bradyrhizobium sp.]|jgi:hypothetical protein|nr:hypothetical protein [Bradyrhizobium sp.]
MTSRTSLYSDGSVFTVACSLKSFDQEPPKKRDSFSHDESFDLAVVEFNDDGSLVDSNQRTALTDCIACARRSNGNGVIVVVFIHGWHHGSQWDDTHFVGFRKVLGSLALRECERIAKKPFGRRVIGVYLAWQGVPASVPDRLRNTWLANFTFLNRYRTAQRIGERDDLRTTIRAIVEHTKCPASGHASALESPLTLIGHSMGGLILETAFLALLKEDDSTLSEPMSPSNSVIQVKRSGQPVSFPDVVIALNSAADSQTTDDIIRQLERRKLEKTARSGPISYSPPLMVSATATDDRATKVIWRLVPGNWRRSTGGHNTSLFTHSFSAGDSGVICERKKDVPDFGQSWSCLRPPTPAREASPTFQIDLPNRERSAVHDGCEHTRYQLKPLNGESKLAWVFQMPPSISAEHNDIFNTRSSLFLLALMQISGATMSLAQNWEDNFEPLLPHQSAD